MEITRIAIPNQILYPVFVGMVACECALVYKISTMAIDVFNSMAFIESTIILSLYSIGILAMLGMIYAQIWVVKFQTTRDPTPPLWHRKWEVKDMMKAFGIQ